MLLIVFSSVDLNSCEKNIFESIYYRYRNLLFYQALKITNNEKDAEDILQEAFIKIAKNIKCVDNVESRETASFLTVITKNTAYDYIRKTSKTKEISLNYEEHCVVESRLKNLEENIEYQELVSVIAQITSPYNEVMYLHYVKDYSVKKTAALLDRKPSTVKMQLVRGKKILIDKLSEALNG